MLLERQLLELQAEINQVTAEIRRSHATISQFDCDVFDALQFQRAMRQAELAELAERRKLREMLLEALPTREGVDAFLKDENLEADIADDTTEIRQGVHPMPVPEAAGEQGAPDQTETSLAFPA